MEDQRSIELLTEVSRDLKRIIGLLEAARSTDRGGKLVDLVGEMLRMMENSGKIESAEPSPLGPGWISNLEAQKRLDVSRTTLYRLTVEKKLLTKRLRGRIYYYTSDVSRLKDHYLK